MIFTRSERRQMERAKEKHMDNLKKSGFNKFEDITDHPNTQIVMAKQIRKPIKVWLNGLFIIQAYEYPCEWGMCHRLMIRRNDAEPEHDWNIFQRIKNELYGPHRVAVEVYPSEEHKQDIANMYWIFVLPEGFNLPVEHKRQPPSADKE